MSIIYITKTLGKTYQPSPSPDDLRRNPDDPRFLIPAIPNRTKYSVERLRKVAPKATSDRSVQEIAAANLLFLKGLGEDGEDLPSPKVSDPAPTAPSLEDAELLAGFRSSSFSRSSSAQREIAVVSENASDLREASDPLTESLKKRKNSETAFESSHDPSPNPELPPMKRSCSRIELAAPQDPYPDIQPPKNPSEVPGYFKKLAMNIQAQKKREEQELLTNSELRTKKNQEFVRFQKSEAFQKIFGCKIKNPVEF